ncbi:hypothetical protein GFS24_00770 [Chitinophaga sp. SYP-B3965]|uniref:hypothetical protein n=1 Tax=Chitinophaga sp. SYP-B3965 TaxID=2663120 RepID=UPI0013BB0820|nr:hypothetical protein [Chitinophaga sp. SYP-B3965]MRG43622.1 hypothetical protein [Chitinophaga sp. SYP-B3965]
MFMKDLVDEYEEELRQEKIAAGIKWSLKSELYMPIPTPAEKEESELRRLNAQRYSEERAREERWIEIGKKAEAAEAAEAALEEASVAETAAQYLP